MPTNGKTIIKDAVAVCSYLSDYGVDQGNAIASTHSYTFDEKTPWNVVRDVADACQTSGGAVGFDGHVDPPGNLWIFPRNSSNSTVDLTDKIIRYKIDYDTYRVKNKIKVYGKTAKILGPLDESTTNWNSIGTISLDSSDKMEGSYSIKATYTSTGVNLRYHFPTPIACKFGSEYKKLHLWIQVSADTMSNDASYHIQLYTNYGSSSGFIKYEKIAFQGKWVELEFSIGPGEEWFENNSPDWATITDLEVLFLNGLTSSLLTLKLDGVRLVKRFSGSAEDSSSQALYGVRMPEPIVDDSLTSDDTCTKKAQSLLSYYKDKVTTLTLTTFGDNAFKPGDRLHVVLSNDGIDDYFRILEVRHTLEDVLWQTELLLSNEPIMIDYIFRKIVEAQKTIAGNQ